MTISATRRGQAPVAARVTYSWAFVMFPLLVSIRTTIYATLACTLLLGVLALVGKPLPAEGRRGQFLPVLVLASCGVATLLRGAAPTAVVTLVATAVIVVLAGRRATAEVAIRSLVTGMAVYLFGNIAGWLVGIDSPGSRVRVSLYEQQGSIFSERVFFPFAVSINEAAVVAAALIGYVVIAWRRGLPVTRTQRLGCVAGVFVILASGTRFPLVVLAILLPAVLLWPRFARVVPMAALVSMALPFVFTWAAPFIAAVSQRLEAVPFLARGQTTTSLAGGSSRAHFWDVGLTFWASVPGTFEHWLGYGFNGHVESRVVFLYYIRGGFVNSPEALTLHSTLLQQMFDSGYVGLGALVFGLFLVGRRFTKAGNLPASTMVGVLFATSAIEIYLVPAYRTTPFCLILALAAISPALKAVAAPVKDEPAPARRRSARR